MVTHCAGGFLGVFVSVGWAGGVGLTRNPSIFLVLAGKMSADDAGTHSYFALIFFWQKIKMPCLKIKVLST
jgi:hypothetical protein